MDFDTAFKVFAVFAGVISAWALFMVKSSRDDLKEVAKESSSAFTKAEVSANDISTIKRDIESLKAELSSIKGDLAEVKKDIYSSSRAQLESFSQLDKRLHGFILQQTGKKHD